MLAVPVIAAVLVACVGAFQQGSTSITLPGPPAGIAERCASGEARCTDQAEALIPLISERLGDRYDGPGLTDTRQVAVPAEAEPEVPTLGVTFAREPPFRWTATSSDGETLTGEATAITVDVAPVLRGEDPYAVVQTPQGPQRFLVPDDLAAQLFDALYRR